MRAFWFFSISFLALYSTKSFALCSPVGGIDYVSGSQKVQYCDGDNWIELSIEGSSGGPPVGSVIAVATATCPSGYLTANGAAVSRLTYASLFTEIGIIYGDGDGSTTFNIPDYRGRFLRSLNGGSGTDPDAASRTDRGDGTTGDNVGTVQAESISSHGHGPGTLSGTTNTAGNHSHTVGLDRKDNSAGGGGSYQVTNNGSTVNLNSSSSGNHSHTATVNSGSTGVSGGAETRPINISVMFCIKSS